MNKLHKEENFADLLATTIVNQFEKYLRGIDLTRPLKPGEEPKLQYFEDPFDLESFFEGPTPLLPKGIL